MDGWFQIDVDKRVARDLKYIKNDIICRQAVIDKNAAEDEKERFIKFCRPLNVIGVTDMTKRQYIKYWNTQYLNFPERKNEIFQAINEKFKSGLTSVEGMIDIIQNSKERDSEKNRAIKLLKGEH